MADGGIALGMGASVIGGAMSKSSADKAGDRMGKATAESNALLQQQAAENTAAYDPYTRLGAGITGKLSNYLGLDRQTPDYIKAQSDYQTAKAAYERMLAPTTSAPLDNNYVRNYGFDSNLSGNSPQSEGFDAASIADAKRIMDESYAKLNKTTMNAPRNKNFGSLLHNFDTNDLNNDPVYNSGLQFGLDEGTKGINRLASANGGIDSGATLKALTRYANDYGTTKAQGAYNNFNANKLNTYNMLAGQSAQGLSAVSGLQSTNSNLLTGQASNVISGASDQANADMAGTASMMNGINGGIGNYLYNQRSNNTPVTGTFGSGGGYDGGPMSLNTYNKKPWFA